MKRRFVTAFVVLFALFAVGIGASIRLLWKSSEDLQRVIHQQEIEELRHDLSLQLRRSRQDLEVSGTLFANKLDDIISNVQELDQSVRGCLGCHHRPGPHGDLVRIVQLVERYKGQYSRFITAAMESAPRERLQLEASSTAAEIEQLVDGLMTSSAVLLETRTNQALADLDRTWKLLTLTLISTFLAAFLVSSLLTRSVAGPLSQLSRAAERISAGHFGELIVHEERQEIGALLDTFNDMSQALANDKKRLDEHLARLRRLNRAVFSLRAAPETGATLPQLDQAMQDLVGAELYGHLLRSDMDDVFLLRVIRHGESAPAWQVAVSATRLAALRAADDGPILAESGGSVARWPFSDLLPDVSVQSFLLCWIELQGELLGALLAVNCTTGEFLEEDGEVLTALGHGVAEALENIRRYQDLRRQIENLRDRGA